MKAGLLRTTEEDDAKVEEIDSELFGISRGNIDLALLCFAWATALSVTCSLSTCGPVAVQQFDEDHDSAQALWMYASYIIGISFTAFISGKVFQSVGRFHGFMIGNALYLVGNAFGSWGVYVQSGPLVIVGALFFGMGQGFANFLRFAAAEIAEVNATGTKAEKHAIKSTALTLVLSGGILAAFFGPIMTSFAEYMIPSVQYLGDFILMGILTVTNMITLCFIRWPTKAERSDTDLERSRTISIASTGPQRTLWDVMQSRVFIFAVLFSASPYAIMSLVMSSVGVTMSDNYGKPLSDVAYTFTCHYLFMYLPGFVSGQFIANYGMLTGCAVGIALNAVAMVVLFFETSTAGFIGGMGLVGMGWNFGFSSGSILLMRASRPEEGLTSNVQAVHDSIVFFSSGAIVLIGGEVYKSFGWRNTVVFGMAMVGAYAVICLTAKVTRVTRTQRQMSVMAPSVSDFGPILDKDTALADDVGELLDLDDEDDIA
jgi:MFS family permease